MDFYLVVNPKNLHVGCVLVQAMMGGTAPNLVSACFDPSLWELSPQDCHRYKMDLEDLPYYVEKLGGCKQMAVNYVEDVKKHAALSTSVRKVQKKDETDHDRQPAQVQAVPEAA